jgi:hypothetical protein
MELFGCKIALGYRDKLGFDSEPTSVSRGTGESTSVFVESEFVGLRDGT